MAYRQDALFVVEVVEIPLPPPRRVRRRKSEPTQSLLDSRPIPPPTLEEWEQVWSTLRADVMRIANSYAGGDPHLADDLFAEAQIRVYAKWPQVIRPSRADRWVIQVSRSAIRDHAKFLGRKKRRAEVLSLNAVIDEVDGTELLDIIPAREAPQGLDHLGIPDHLIVVAEALSQGMDGAEIRARYRMSLAKFNAIKKEIRNHLEKQLI